MRICCRGWLWLWLKLGGVKENEHVQLSSVDRALFCFGSLRSVCCRLCRDVDQPLGPQLVHAPSPRSLSEEIRLVCRREVEEVGQQGSRPKVAFASYGHWSTWCLYKGMSISESLRGRGVSVNIMIETMYEGSRSARSYLP